MITIPLMILSLPIFFIVHQFKNLRPLATFIALSYAMIGFLIMLVIFPLGLFICLIGCWLNYLVDSKKEIHDHEDFISDCGEDKLIMAYVLYIETDESPQFLKLLDLYEAKRDAGCEWSDKMLTMIESHLEDTEKKSIIDQVNKELASTTP